MMESGVLCARDNDKILKAVICFVAVDVMNDHTGRDRAVRAFPNHAVLTNLAPDADIASLVNPVGLSFRGVAISRAPAPYTHGVHTTEVIFGVFLCAASDRTSTNREWCPGCVPVVAPPQVMHLAPATPEVQPITAVD